tara:strand:- start:1890 stop:2657 length:768 start_codon:yes stop_codon:yes gene_type:complete
MELETLSKKLVNAFLKNKLIKPIPTKITKNITKANEFRKLCESKIKKEVIGFKAGGTAFPVLKKLKEKEPFYASVYKHNFLKSGKKVKISNYTLGMELEVCYLIKKEFFFSNKKISKKHIHKYISYMAPCIEIVGYRQRKKGIRYLGDLSSDFGANMKFLIGAKKKYKKIKIGNLKTNINNKKYNININGNTKTVYINPLNSLRFVLIKLRKDKVNLNKDFYVFTGSTVGIIPLKFKGFYTGRIEKLGSVKAVIS